MVSKALHLKRRRQLILTTWTGEEEKGTVSRRGNRLIYVDLKEKEIKGEVSGVGLSENVKVFLTPQFQGAFKVVDEEGKEYHFHDLLGSGDVWQDLVGNASTAKLGVFGLMWGPRSLLSSTSLLQAHIFKRPITSKITWQSWRKRWFVLHGRLIMWFKSERDVTPKGKIVITAETKVVDSGDKDHAFRIITPMLPVGITLACMNAKTKKVWVRTILRASSTCRDALTSNWTKRHLKTDSISEMWLQQTMGRAMSSLSFDEDDVG
eukprot:g5279.t1